MFRLQFGDGINFDTVFAKAADYTHASSAR
jgi:hypothetical protein